ncbi:hypothetical protein HPC49_03865 [Pyxidicoccus fallax]|uniref:AsmA-like C-terminal domain-containing protein n=1 Tax=Pyxidicoccus fallax TaxID=394095 RepID=A0A848LCY3_9BACT|nr:hypothetical protein [Pyxidicoccus fallax]NMO14623.1 hypothetical protein [Pyxidicoccus fallax]NPC77387.1 hypothetical protein [Pyxidicoccus fallax]
MRVLAWAMGGVLLLEVLLNLALNTPLVPALVHRATPRTRLGWSRAWWPWPGQLQARDFFLERRDAHARWRVEAEDVEAHLDVVALFRRQLVVEGVRARGVRARVEPLPSGEQAPPKPPKPHPWRIELRGLEVQAARELVVGTVRYTGPAEARGTVRLIAGQRLTVEAGQLRLTDGFVEVQGHRAARLESLSTNFSLEAFRRAPEGWEVFGGLSGRLQAKADLLALDWLGASLPPHARVDLREGAGTMEAEVRIQKGVLEPGSRVEAQGAPLQLWVGPAHARAPWRVHGTVEADADGEARGRLRLSFSSVHVDGPHARLLELPEVALTFHAEPRLGLAAPVIQRELHVAPSKPVDLRMLNAWTGQTFRVDSGSATLKASGHGDSEHARGSLRLTVDSDLVEARAGDTRLLGRASAEFDTRRLSLQGRRVGLDGTTLWLSQVSADLDTATLRGWSGTFSLPQATLLLSPPELEARFSGRFASAAPFVALLTGSKKLPRFLAPLLQARELEVTGRVLLGPPGLQVRELRITDENLQLQGRMDLSRGATHALVLATLDGITGAVEVTPEDTHVQLHDARRWYEERLAAPP